MKFEAELLRFKQIIHINRTISINFPYRKATIKYSQSYKTKPSQKRQIKKCKNPHQNPSKPRQGLGKHHRPKTVPKDENWDGLKEAKSREFEDKNKVITNILQ